MGEKKLNWVEQILENEKNSNQAIRFVGSVETFEELPATGNEVGDMYNVAAAHGDVAAGTNYAWNGTEWDALAGGIGKATVNTFGLVKLGTSTNLDGANAGVVGLTSGGQMVIAPATNSKLGVVKTSAGNKAGAGTLSTEGRIQMDNSNKIWAMPAAAGVYGVVAPALTLDDNDVAKFPTCALVKEAVADVTVPKATTTKIGGILAYTVYDDQTYSPDAAGIIRLDAYGKGILLPADTAKFGAVKIARNIEDTNDSSVLTAAMVKSTLTNYATTSSVSGVLKLDGYHFDGPALVSDTNPEQTILEYNEYGVNLGDNTSVDLKNSTIYLSNDCRIERDDAEQLKNYLCFVAPDETDRKLFMQHRYVYADLIATAESVYPIGSVYATTDEIGYKPFSNNILNQVEAYENLFTWTLIGSQTIGTKTVYYYERTA